MSVTPLEYVGSIHIFLGPYRGNPVALYLRRNGERVAISPKVYPFSSVVGEAETPNKAAADFEEKWKAKGLVSADMYDGPSWEGGIKPERPAPPKPAAAPKAAEAGASPGAKSPAAPGAATAPSVPKPPATAPTPTASAGTPSAPKPAPQSPPPSPAAATLRPSTSDAKTASAAQSTEEPKADPSQSS